MEQARSRSVGEMPVASVGRIAVLVPSGVLPSVTGPLPACIIVECLDIDLDHFHVLQMLCQIASLSGRAEGHAQSKSAHTFAINE